MGTISAGVPECNAYNVPVESPINAPLPVHVTVPVDPPPIAIQRPVNKVVTPPIISVPPRLDTNVDTVFVSPAPGAPMMPVTTPVSKPPILSIPPHITPPATSFLAQSRLRSTLRQAIAD